MATSTVNSTSNVNRGTSNRALFWGIAAAVLVVLAIIYAMTRKDYATTTPATMAPATTSETSTSSTVHETQQTTDSGAATAPMNRNAETGAAVAPGTAKGVGTDAANAGADAEANGVTGDPQGTSAYPATTRSNAVAPIAPGAKGTDTGK